MTLRASRLLSVYDCEHVVSSTNFAGRLLSSAKPDELSRSVLVLNRQALAAAQIAERYPTKGGCRRNNSSPFSCQF